MRADNSSHLIEAAQQRRLQCTARVRTALDDMERDGGPVTIVGVAARAKVSRTFLYDDAQAPLLERLRAVANAQPSSGRPACRRTSGSAPSRTKPSCERCAVPTRSSARTTTGSPTNSPSRSGSSVTCAEDSPERPVADTVSNTNTQVNVMIKRSRSR
jgi:hypothetical protein